MKNVWTSFALYNGNLVAKNVIRISVKAASGVGS